MKKIIVLMLLLVLAGFGCKQSTEQTAINLPPELRGEVTTENLAPPLPEKPMATYFETQVGEKFSVGDLTIEIKKIESLTATGCTAVPLGCPDSLDLAVRATGTTQEIKLIVLGGKNQSAGSERLIFGHRVVLSKINQDRATIGVFIAKNPTTPPFEQ